MLVIKTSLQGNEKHIQSNWIALLCNFWPTRHRQTVNKKAICQAVATRASNQWRLKSLPLSLRDWDTKCAKHVNVLWNSRCDTFYAACTWACLWKKSSPYSHFVPTSRCFGQIHTKRCIIWPPEHKMRLKKPKYMWKSNATIGNCDDKKQKWGTAVFMWIRRKAAHWALIAGPWWKCFLSRKEMSFSDIAKSPHSRYTVCRFGHIRFL